MGGVTFICVSGCDPTAAGDFTASANVISGFKVGVLTSGNKTLLQQALSASIVIVELPAAKGLFVVKLTSIGSDSHW